MAKCTFAYLHLHAYLCGCPRALVFALLVKREPSVRIICQMEFLMLINVVGRGARNKDQNGIRDPGRTPPKWQMTGRNKRPLYTYGPSLGIAVRITSIPIHYVR